MKEISRRSFVIQGLKAGTALGGLSMVSPFLRYAVHAKEKNPDISIVDGQDYFTNTVKAVEALGGIQKFVKRGDRVGLLANSAYKKPGTYTRPDVLLGVAWLCKEAGAEVYSLKGEKEKYWRRSPISEKHKSLIDSIKEDGSDHQTVKIDKGKTLKQADVLAGFMDYDKVINIPILKNHGEIHLTCTLKNTMGVSSFGTNIKFHTGENVIRGAVKMIGNMYHNMDHLSQCIADLNMIRNWDLCVVDATEFISTNGPSGPGEMVRENKVVAGADAVAVEALCGRYLNLDPRESMLVNKACQNGLGEMDLGKLTIRETGV